MVPRAGFEPARVLSHQILSLPRLPFRHPGSSRYCRYSSRVAASSCLGECAQLLAQDFDALQERCGLSAGLLLRLELHDCPRVNVMVVGVSEQAIQQRKFFLAAQVRVVAEHLEVRPLKLLFVNLSANELVHQTGVWGHVGGFSAWAGRGAFAFGQVFLEVRFEVLEGDVPVVQVELRLLILEDDQLRALVRDTGAFGDPVGGRACFDNPDDADGDIAAVAQEAFDVAPALHGFVAGSGLKNGGGRVLVNEGIDLFGGVQGVHVFA